ncbi:MAG: hypothetical protein DRI40_07445 [Chloroflexi bacterium]|nr:MAG: hypothetical protein DRI40_07445 [Chloroflexota bacterium]
MLCMAMGSGKEYLLVERANVYARRYRGERGAAGDGEGGARGGGRAGKGSLLPEESGAVGNGYYSRGLDGLFGRIGELRVPRTREGGFRPFFLEPYQRASYELVVAMYQGGCSSRDISRTIGALIDGRYSATWVSRITDVIQDKVEAYRRRPLEKWSPIIFVDGVVIKIRRGAVDGGLKFEKSSHFSHLSVNRRAHRSQRSGPTPNLISTLALLASTPRLCALQCQFCHPQLQVDFGSSCPLFIRQTRIAGNESLHEPPPRRSGQLARVVLRRFRQPTKSPPQSPLSLVHLPFLYR